jgi:transcriptional regulator with GAF, ATPase, and Fis domain
VVSRLEFDKLLQRVVEGGLYVTRSDGAVLLLLDQTSTHLELVAARGKLEYSTGPFPPSAGDRRLGQVLQAGVPVRIHSPHGASIRLQTGDAVQAVLQVPLEVRGKILGLLSVDRRGYGSPFGKHDEQMLSILADYTVIALEYNSNARSPASIGLQT